MEREVTEFLTERGFGAAEIAAAEREGRLMSLFTDRLVGDATLSICDVAARTGVPTALVARVWRAAGFPDPQPDAPVFTDADAEALSVFGLAVGFFGTEPTIHLVRVMGTSLARIAEAEVSAGLTYDRANLPADDLLGSLEASMALDETLPLAEQALVHLLRRHLVVANRRLRATAPADDLLDLTVGFADLSGSTALSQRLTAHEFAAALADFEAISTDAINAGGGRVVKLIGDEVMFVSASPDAACHIALALIDGCARHSALPPLRAALASGPVVARDGDYYGPVVHVASRLVGLAPPDALVGSRTLVDRIAPRMFVADRETAYALRGLAEPVEVFRIARA